MAHIERSLTDGPVRRAVLSLSAPMVFGLLAVLSIGLADAYFLGLLGQTQLAAVGFFYPVIIAVMALSIGLGAGMNAALSQAIGAGRSDAAVNRMAVHGLALGIGLGAAVAAVVWAAQDAIFSAMGADAAVRAEIAAYLGWWAPAFPLLVATMQMNAVFRAHGDGATPAMLLGLAAAVNIGLDPLLIFGLGPLPAFGTEGAGIATFAARAATFAVAAAIALRRGRVSWPAHVARGAVASARRILGVGGPAALGRAINPLGMALVTAAAATLGEAAVAGFGAAVRVQAVAMVPFFALASGLAPVVGQNWGAGEVARTRCAVRFALALAAGYGAAAGIALWFFANAAAGLLAAGPEDRAFAATYLQWAGLSLAGIGALTAGNAALNARGLAVSALALSAARNVLLLVPLAWVGVTALGFAGIPAAVIVANLGAGFLALIVCRAAGLVGWEVAPIAAPARRLRLIRRRVGSAAARARQAARPAA
ncbi:MATE family efflux transporter [Rhodobacteraceae bacterium CCMM004]|nr:MATE family efflux transporter [Rhodobacteraceae bacterium CCMM004]